MSLPAGIPDLLEDINRPFEYIIEAKAVANLALDWLGLNASQWGIYRNGVLALHVDGFSDFGVSNGSQIANYRIEQGAFSTYNKVDSPYDLRIGAIKTGTGDEVDVFLSELEKISNDIELYDIVTPEAIYSFANVERYSYRRTTEKGAHIIYAEITFKQIMNTTETAFSATPTKEIAGQPIVSGGLVQTTPLAPQSTITAVPF
jgi:hypothetical protein